jgi:ATP-dependent Clp protease ATP-binding subunit ClpA
LSEQFLQILQTGQAQSGHGTTFSCASLIIIFTLNLPDGADERLFTPIGFGQPEAGDNLNTLTTELKKMLSPAFLSRMGQAVLFNHLSQRTLAMIMESALEKSLRTAGKNFGIDINQIQISPSLGKNFIKIKNKDAIAFGARPLEDRARELVVNAFLAFIENHNMQLAGTVNLAVKLSPKGERLLLTAY